MSKRKERREEFHKEMDEFMKKTPLSIRLQVLIHSYFLEVNECPSFIPLDEDGNENEEVVELQVKSWEQGKELYKKILEEVEEWVGDGAPLYSDKIKKG